MSFKISYLSDLPFKEQKAIVNISDADIHLVNGLFAILK